MDFRAVRDQTIKELEKLIEERRDIDRKAAALRSTLNGLNALLDAQQDKFRLEPPPLPPGYEGLREMGLTDAIRKLFENEPDRLSPKDVRAKFEAFDYRLPRTNPLATIHRIFTRLEKAGEIKPIEGQKNAYQWVNPAERQTVGVERFNSRFRSRFTGR